MAKICVDVRCLLEGRRTGVEEYTLNLLQNLFEIDKDNEYVLFFNSWKKSKADFSWIEKYGNVALKKFQIPNKLLNLSFWYLGWPKIDALVGGADIVFMPNLIFGSVSAKTRLIITIHDLSYERYPEYFSLKRRFWHTFINPKKLCKRADKIIAVSKSSGNDIRNLYKIDRNKIEVIYSAAGDKFRVINRNDEKLIKIKEKYALPYKFILYLGTIEPRKNIAGLIKAYDRLKKDAKEKNNEELARYKLVIAGEKGWLSEAIFREIRKSYFKNDIKLVNFVADNDKEYFLNLASIFVYPSFFEGFGFPPLEAMQCGVPVIASNNSAIPEVLGNAAILVDPDKPDEILRALKEVLLGKELAAALVKKGLRKSAELNWRKTAELLLKQLKK